MFRRPLIRAFLRRGWRVTVVAPEDEYTNRVVETGAKHLHIDMDTKGTNPVRELFMVQRFRKAYHDLKPDVVLQYTIKPDIYGSIAARALGLPVINTITGLGTMFSGGPKETLARLLYRYAFRSADLVLFQNEDDKALFIRSRIVCKERTGLVPGSGVDLDRFAPRPRGEGPFMFLMIGRLLKAKGVEHFIIAARRVKEQRPNVRFVLLGSHDPGDPECVDQKKLSQATVDGIVDHSGHVDDIRPILANADCVVLPSFYREGVPRSLLEAASMAKPLIAADSVGTREPVRDGVNGFLCKPRDPMDLAEKMERMMALDPQRRAEMGEASRRYMRERFDESTVIETYLRAAERLAGQGNIRT
jgi:glycosyltransferase involved in cell wall biosynthesis